MADLGAEAVGARCSLTWWEARKREGMKVPKFRKKPVVIEAEVYRPGLEDGFENGRPYIETLEGRHYISSGDYVVTGIRGERYPVKPDIFEATYEPVEE